MSLNPPSTGAYAAIASEEADIATSAAVGAASSYAAFLALTEDYDASLVDSVPISGDLFLQQTVCVVSTQANATVISDKLRPIGFTTTVGNSGNNTSAAPFVYIPSEVAALISGVQIEMTTVWSTSSTLHTEKVLNDGTNGSPVAPLVQAILEDGTTVTVSGATVSDTYNGGFTVLTRICTFTAPANVAAMCNFVKIVQNLANTHANAIALTGVSWRVSTAGGLANAQSLQAKINAILNNPATIGAVFEEMLCGGVPTNGGATGIYDTYGRLLGMTTPVGSNGSGANVAPRVYTPPALSSLIAGRRLNFVASIDLSATYTRTLLPVAVVILFDGTSPSVTTRISRNLTIGTTRFFEFSCVLPANVASIRNAFQQSGTGLVTGTDETCRLTGYYGYVSGPVDNLGLLQIGERVRALRATAPLGSGPVLEDTQLTAVTADGGEEILNSIGEVVGFSIPATSAGALTYLREQTLFLPKERTNFVSAAFRYRVHYATNAAWARTLTLSLQMLKSDLSTRTPSQILSYNYHSGTEGFVEFVATVNAGDIGFDPFFQVPTGATVTGTVDTFIVTGTEFEIINSPNLWQTMTTFNAQVAFDRVQARAVRQVQNYAAGGHDEGITVAPSGADYDNFSEAFAAPAYYLPSSTNRYKIVAASATYDEVSIPTRAFIDLVGTYGHLTRVVGYLPPDATLDDIQHVSTWDPRGDSNISNIYSSIQQGRYTWHLDDDRDVYTTTVVSNCHFDHFGNAEAIEYQINNAGDPGGIWNVTLAAGCGVHMGASLTIRDSVMIGYSGGFSCHNNVDYADPSPVLLKNSQFGFRGMIYVNGSISGADLTVTARYGTSIYPGASLIGAAAGTVITAQLSGTPGGAGTYSVSPGGQTVLGVPLFASGFDGISVRFISLGAGMTSPWNIDNCNLTGKIELQADRWLSTRPENQPAMRNEWDMVITGPCGAPYVYTDAIARAFRIDSASTSASAGVLYDLTALGAVAILGQATYDMNDAGLMGGAGTVNVDPSPVGLVPDALINGLGVRLGNCSVTPKPLPVYFDGSGTPVTINFNEDFTARDNAYVVAFAQTAIGAAGTVSLQDRTALYRPLVTAEEGIYQNTSSGPLLRGRGVVRNLAGGIRYATASDPARAFLGVLYENLPVGGTGRVKTGGALRATQDLSRTDGTGPFQANQTLGVINSSGQFSLAASIALFIAVTPQDVQFL